jgi:beta-galactosidase
VSGTSDPQLYKNYRRGAFSYLVPLADGTYSVTLGFLEPYKGTAVGNRVFDVIANGEKKLENFDVVAAAGAYRQAVTRTFMATVSGGRLELDFKPVRGEAVVSNIAIRNVRLQAASGR